MRASILLPAMLAVVATATCNGTMLSIGNDEKPTPFNLIYLLTVYATETTPLIIGDDGHGSRLFIPITGGTFSGPGLQGKVAAAGGDWGNYNAANTIFSPDAKIVLETDDGATILISGRGRSPYITYEFETGNEKYSWLNAAVGLGLIQVGENNLTAEIFQLLCRDNID
ncbi:hypothetical protein BJ170DRAFT_597836 [Xylariales sp. AK1849]|nr:hypothetical protein BJ170DRAFT_597836 [Xylariales sp. AK1849]